MEIEISKIVKIISDIENTTFKFSGDLNHMEAYSSNGYYFWKIGLRIKKDNSDSSPYCFISYSLNIKGQEFHVSSDSISFEVDEVSKTMGYAKNRLIASIGNLLVSL